MHFKRILSSFAAIGTLSVLVGTGCSSSSSNKTTTENTGGTAGTSNAATGGSSATQTTVGGSSSTAGSQATGGTTSATSGGNATGGISTATSGGNATGGISTATSGGNAAGGTTTGIAGSNPTGGASPTSTTGGTSTGGTSATGATLNDLIGAICNWEFKCCDAGEAKWELGPTTSTAAACKTAFTYLLNSDNTAASPYPATLPGLLTILGYSVDPSKVTENPTGIAACILEWNAKACNSVAPAKVAPTHCTATTYGAIAACDLTNLVKPKQTAGQPCNFALNQSSTGNDIECVAGTSCVNVGDPDNPSTSSPTCVTRGVASAVCTSDAKCDYGFYCDTTGTGTCVAKSGPGEACSYKSETAPVSGQLAKQCKPGLTCNPATKTCVEPCKTGYVCSDVGGSDFSCPSGQSCIPITVGSTTTFSTCSASGSTIPRCNSAEDCGANYYCNGSTCAPVLVAGDTCVGTAGSGECGTARYCNAAKKCAAYTLVNNSCTQATTGITSTECDPVNAIGCVYKWDTTLAAATYVCAAALLSNGDRCGNSFDCFSNKCEYATSSATYKTCIAGAAVGAACLATASATPPTTNMTTCAPGLTCKSGACVAQVGPGGACESSTTAGQADNTMCKNGTCNSTQWSASSAIMCTDAPVAVTNGGTGVTCDGV